MREHGEPAAVSPRDIVRSGLCIGCGSCVAHSPTAGVRMRFDRYGQLKPHGSAKWLSLESAAFSRICPFSPFAADETALADVLFAQAPRADDGVGRFHRAWVGSVAEGGFRAAGSSGGMVSRVAAELLRRGLVDGVAHVAAVDHPQAGGKLFRYQISRTDDDVRAGAKSRYYPVEMSEVLTALRAQPGRYAVVGLPCFIKAVQLLRLEDPVMGLRVRFALGLVCGHMKSARLVDSFAHQMGISVGEVESIDYRLKDASRPANWYTAQLTLRNGRTVQRDWFQLAEGDWGSGFFQNSACNVCDDVVAETADISFGDAWVEPYSSDGRGTNVVITRSEVLDELVAGGIAQGQLALQAVDKAFVQKTCTSWPA